VRLVSLPQELYLIRYMRSCGPGNRYHIAKGRGPCSEIPRPTRIRDFHFDNPYAFLIFIVNRRVTRFVDIDLAYAVGLLIVTFLTVPAFDRDVWLRDIDSSPSPFPMQVLFAFVFPCLAPFFEATRFLVPQSSTQEPPSLFCLQGCNCELNKVPIDQHEPPVTATTRSMENAPASVSARTLVRVPNAIEQRDSTVISFLQ
jgi:hypothetical protein